MALTASYHEEMGPEKGIDVVILKNPENEMFYEVFVFRKGKAPHKVLLSCFRKLDNDEDFNSFSNAVVDEIINNDLRDDFKHNGFQVFLVSVGIQNVPEEFWDRYDSDKRLAAMANKHVKPETLKWLRRGYKLVEMFSEQIFFALTEGNQRARVQAMCAYPSAFLELIKNPNIVRLIDEERPITEEVMKTLGLSPKEYKRFMKIQGLLHEGLLEPESSLSKFLHLQVLLSRPRYINSIMKKISETSLPSDVESLTVLFESFAEARSFAVGSRIPMDLIDRVLFKVKSHEWKDFVSPFQQDDKRTLVEIRDYINFINTRIRAAVIIHQFKLISPEKMRAINQTVEDLRAERDVSEERKKYLVNGLKEIKTKFGEAVPFAESKKHTDDIVSDLLENCSSFKEIRSLSTRWHHQNQQIDADLSSVPDKIEWGTLLGEHLTPQGTRIRELNSNHALEEQGKREQHCVGGYTSTVMGATKNEANAIFSVESGDRTLSTVQVRISVDYSARDRKLSYDFKVVQNMGKRNSPPCDEAINAVKKLMKTLSEIPPENVSDYIKGLMFNERGILADVNQMIMKYGVNVFKDDVDEEIVSRISRVLPERMRGLSATDWLDVFKSDDAAQALSEKREEKKTEVKDSCDFYLAS